MIPWWENGHIWLSHMTGVGAPSTTALDSNTNRLVLYRNGASVASGTPGEPAFKGQTDRKLEIGPILQIPSPVDLAP